MRRLVAAIALVLPLVACAEPVTVSLGSNGSAVGIDGDTGQAWLVHAPDDRGRFTFNFAPTTDWILARRSGGQWSYDNNNAYVDFTPASTDRALFRLNLDARTAGRRAVRAPLDGMAVGSDDSDLSITADRYPDLETANPGEWHVAGTFYTYDDEPSDPADDEAVAEATLEIAEQLDAIRLLLRFFMFLGGFWVGFAGWNQIVIGARKETPL